MANIAISAVTLSDVPVIYPIINIKYRLASAPDVAASYTDKGNYFVKLNGDLVTPAVISGLSDLTEYILWVTNECSNSSKTLSITTGSSVPIIPCGDASSYSGGESFPTEQIITLGATLGNVVLMFDALSIPDKYIVIFDGIEVINTGYRGDISYQSALDAELASRGLPPETITFPGAGSVNFNKTTATTTAIIRVYAPLEGTSWSYTMNCPV